MDLEKTTAVKRKQYPCDHSIAKKPKVVRDEVAMVKQPASEMAAASITQLKRIDAPPTLMTIPTEIRLHILQEVLTFASPLRFVRDRPHGIHCYDSYSDCYHDCPRINMSILLYNKQLYLESLPELFSRNAFMFDPWDSKNILPPRVFRRIQHVIVKLECERDICDILWGQASYLLLLLFTQVKTLTLDCTEDTFFETFSKENAVLESQMHSMCKVPDVELLVAGEADETLGSKIKQALLNRVGGACLADLEALA